MERLTDEEIYKVLGWNEKGTTLEKWLEYANPEIFLLRRVTQAQLEANLKAYQETIKEISENLEAKFPEFAHTDIIKSGYQSDVDEYNGYSHLYKVFKSKYLGGKND